MEYEIRFYYPSESYKEKLALLNAIKELNYEGKSHEITSQFDHPCKEFSFYSQAVDGRFRVRKTENENSSKCLVSFKRRLKDTTASKVNKEEEIELNIDPKEYDNLLLLIKNVLHMKEIETYERYRTKFSNEEVEIVLDEYPFGLALEIEAAKTLTNQEEVIDKYIKLLGLDYQDAYRLSWDDKYEGLCKSQGKKIYTEVLFGKDMPKIDK